MTTSTLFSTGKKCLTTALLPILALFAILTATPAIGAPTLSAITVTPANPTINVGQTQQFTATGTFSDGTSRALISGGGSGTWVGKASMSSPRSGAAVAEVNGILYAVGGGDYNPGGSGNLATVEAYDPVTNTWSPRASMSTARSELAAGVVNGKLYAVGGAGVGGSFGSLATVEAYDPATNTWTTKASMSTPRAGAAVAVVNGTLYAVGGIDYGYGSLATVEAYDPVTNTWTPRASMSTPHYAATAVVVNGKLYAVGGGGGSWGYYALATVEAYDPATDTWMPRASMSTPRFAPGAGVVNGTLYAVGGSNSVSSELATVEAYDPATDTWTPRTSMVTPRFSPAVGVVNGTLYAVGGQTSRSSLFLATVEAYTPPGEVTWSSGNASVATIAATGLASAGSLGSATITANSAGLIASATLNVSVIGAPTLSAITVTPANPTINVGQTQQFTATGTFSDGTSRALIGGDGTWVSEASMSAPRAGHAVGVVNGILYAVGGYGSRTVEVYGQVGLTWTPKASMSAPRGGHAVGVVNGILYAVGGYNYIGNQLATVEAYDPATNTWTPKASMPTPRGSHAVGVVNGILYAVGGWNGINPVATVEAYDPVTNTWTPKASLPIPLSDLAVGVVNGILYAVGGWNGISDVATVEAYDPVTNTWTLKPSMSTPREGHAVGVVDGTLYAVGGQNGSGLLATVEAYTPPGEVTWSSSNTSVATIAATGLASAVSPGSATITANSAGLIARATLTVAAPDTTPPIISFHSNLTVTATSASGAIVNYTLPTATDNIDPIVTVTCVPASGSTFPVGTTTVTCSATDTAGNTAHSSFTVTVTTLSITTVTLADATAGTAYSATITASGGTTPYTFSTSFLPAGLVLNSTTGEISGTPTTAGLSIFNVSVSDAASKTLTSTLSINVIPGSQSIGFGILGNKTYGDVPLALSATGGASGNPVTFTAGTTGVCTSSGTNGSTITIVGAGVCIVTAHQAGNSNYNAALDVSQSFTVARAILTVTAVNQVMLFNASLPSLTATLTGFKNGETLATSGVTGSSNLTTTATATSPVGSYPITAAMGTLASNNYSFTFVNGTMLIQYATSGLCGGDVGHMVLRPVNSDGTSVFNMNRTVPVKFRVCDANGLSIGTPGVIANFRLIQTVSGTVVAVVDEAVGSTTPDASFRWDSTNQLWIFNLATNSLSINMTYSYQIMLNDGSAINFKFGLK